ncbi:Predicted ATPase with chaperone activity [Pseudomonas syringae pv. actinidiae]|uniref:Predicted ATPase with chaperone activity n=4 Tax=Pseudomonas syringae TaxID=317 RepID=A0A2V0QLQ0_PSESF|nr:Predicted ATPase with chaperone activity [Pseudomonas syringae pv. actinidiae]
MSVRTILGPKQRSTVRPTRFCTTHPASCRRTPLPKSERLNHCMPIQQLRITSMNESSSSDALAEWHKRLNDRRQWTNPAVTYRFLARMAEDMQAGGLVDPLERFELFELASAAFCHFTEEGNHEWRHQASDYLAYNKGGVVVGSLLNSRYVLHEADQSPYHATHFAFLDEKNELIMRDYKKYGVLEGRYIYTETGQTLTLVEQSRQINGVDCQRLADEDQYRALIDASAVALDRDDFKAYVALWERHSYSIFIRCLHCCDRFDLREDCTACAGRGFVEDPECPNKLPQSFSNQGCTAALSQIASRSSIPCESRTERPSQLSPAPHPWPGTTPYVK